MIEALYVDSVIEIRLKPKALTASFFLAKYFCSKPNRIQTGKNNRLHSS